MHFRQGAASLFYSSHITPLHSHNTIQLICDITGSFLFRTESTSWKKFSGLIIKEEINHQLDTNGSIQLIIYVDPDTLTGQNLTNRYLLNNDFTDITIDFSPTEEGIFQECVVSANNSTLELLIALVMAKVTNPIECVCSDKRVSAVLQLIKQPDYIGLSITQLAEKVFVSPSRLRAVFRTQVGMPIHKYIMQTRLLSATNAIINGSSIQNAAYATGFTDASHFNRMMLKTFGITPSTFIRDNRDFTISGDESFYLETYSVAGI